MFIVIEGLDGAGKSTQVARLRDELSQRGIESEYLHFPRFDAPVYGDMIARFLRGEFGDASQVNPYLVAILYAGDRNDASDMISGWLEQGKWVIVDRYVFSNIAYQGPKCERSEGKITLRDWIFNMEYNVNDIVKPDMTLFLDVPFKFTEKKLSETREGNDREYLNGKQDIHEASLSLQQKVRDMYISLDGQDKTYHIIDCSSSQGRMLSPDDIFEKIFMKVSDLL